jgi:hypothetical protein
MVGYLSKGHIWGDYNDIFIDKDRFVAIRETHRTRLKCGDVEEAPRSDTALPIYFGSLRKVIERYVAAWGRIRGTEQLASFD